MSEYSGSTRTIRKSHDYSSREAADLLSAVLAAELSAPSRTLWLVSPWISDIPILDNTTGAFTDLERWGAKHVGLVEVLVSLASVRCRIVVGTTPDRHNRFFLDRLATLARDLNVEDWVSVDVDQRNELHTKSVIGDDFVIVGSMNLTMNGVFLREEYVELKTAVEDVTQARLDASERFGGRLS